VNQNGKLKRYSERGFIGAGRRSSTLYAGKATYPDMTNGSLKKTFMHQT
jgi:hypothetical protein